MCAANNIDSKQCRNEQCRRKFSTKGNCGRHEKQFGQSPSERRGAIHVAVFDETLLEYHCPFPGCAVSSAYKTSVTRHIKAGCPTLNVEVRGWRDHEKSGVMA